MWKRLLAHSADMYRPGAAKAIRAAAETFKPDVVHTNTVQGSPSPR